MKLTLLFLLTTWLLQGQATTSDTNTIVERFRLSPARLVAGESRLLMWPADHDGVVSITSVSTIPSLPFLPRVDVDTTAGGANIRLTVLPTTPPGAYELEIGVITRRSRPVVVSTQITIDAVRVPRLATGRNPVVLLNGYQLFCAHLGNTIADSVYTFGQLAKFLGDNEVPVLFFNNCAYGDLPVEQLAGQLDTFISQLAYTDGTPVTQQVDLIAHSMGGLIARAYLAGLEHKSSLVPQNRAFSPPNLRVRKLVLIATPNFGSFKAYDAPPLGAQGTELIPGSSLLWQLATWNQNQDDLRGVDALAVVGNAGSHYAPGSGGTYDDGVVSLTSASLGFAREDQRTRVVAYCHVTPDAITRFGMDCDGQRGIADIDDSSHQTWQIIHSFLADTPAVTPSWTEVGFSPSQNPWLSQYGGLYFGLVDAGDTQYVSDLTGVSLGSVQLTNGGATNTIYYSEFIQGTGTFQFSRQSASPIGCGSYTSQPGFYATSRCKYGPIVSSVTPRIPNVSALLVQAGTIATINGIGFGQQCSTCGVAAYPDAIPLTVASGGWSDQAITVTVPAGFAGLKQLVVSAASGTDSINIMVVPASTISLSSTQLQFSFTSGGPVSGPQSVTVSAASGGVLSWTASASVPWITTSASSSVLTVSVNPAGLAPGSYKGTISISVPGATNSPQSVSIALTVSPALSSRVVVTSVTNAASGAGGAISPGEIVTIKGSGLGPVTGVPFTVNSATEMIDSTLAGTQVFFGSIAAPITYTSAGQINAIVPYEVAAQSQVLMQVSYQGVASAGTSLQIATAAPGVFTFSGTGIGQAMAANQDGSLNGQASPAAPGSYVTIYFTGGGQTNPPGATGSITGSVLKYLTQNISVTVGGIAAAVSFDGAAPNSADGFLQLNIQLANSTPPGPSQPVVITVGGISSPPTATLVVAAPAGFSLNGKSFTINGTLTIGTNSMPFEIQALANGDGSYAVEVDDNLAFTSPIQLIFLINAQANNTAGSTIVFSGSTTSQGFYLDSSNVFNPFSSSITAASVTINFTSLSTGAAVTGSLSLSVSTGQISGKFTGTVTGTG